MVLCGLVFALFTGVGRGETGTPQAPSRADSGTQIIEQRGGVIGAGRSKITLSVVIKGGKYSKIKDARFKQVPVSCTGDGGVTQVHGSFLGIRIDGSRFRYHGGFASPSFRGSDMLFHGKIQDSGARAKGRLRWRFFDHTGDRCKTGLTRWKTHD